MTDQHITIHMTDRRPLRVRKESWPIVAKAEWYDSEHRSQANRTWTLRVRRHADGRTAVYGLFDSTILKEPNTSGGYLLNAEEAEGSRLIWAIRSVAVIIGREELAQYCIQSLPAEDDDDDSQQAARAALTTAALLSLQHRVEAGELSLADALLAAYQLDS